MLKSKPTTLSLSPRSNFLSKFYISFVTCCMMIAASPVGAFALNGGGGGGGGTDALTSKVKNVFGQLIDAITNVANPIAVFCLIVAGITWMVSNNPQATGMAKAWFIRILVAVGIINCVDIIVTFIDTATGSK